MQRSLLKSNAKAQLKGKWAIAVITFIVYGIICGILSAITQFAESRGLFLFLQLIGIFINGAIFYGLTNFSLNIAKENEVSIYNILDGFNGKIFFKTVGLFFLIMLVTIIGTILFIVPGIIVFLMFSQAFFILCEDNTKSVTECLKESAEMMEGNKMDLFVLCLSFIGWWILACVTFGIAGLWIAPYQKVTYANYYLSLKEKVA